MPVHRSILAVALAAALGCVLSTGPATAVPPQSFHVNLLKQINVYPGVNDCWGYRAPNGKEIAIYGHQSGTSFVDATNPAGAVEIANIPGPTSVWRDMFTYSHYCYIVTEGSGPGTGLQIVDLANPLAPVLVSTYTANNFTTAHNIFIDVGAGVAYAVGAGPSGGTQILSLANPTSPVQLDYFDPYYIHDIFVADGVGYAGAINSGTLRIIDFSNPSNPVTIATHSYPDAFTHNAWPNEARTHCTTTDELSFGHLRVWDITDLGDIQLASEYEVPDNIIHDVRLVDDVAYLSYYTAGARLVDLWDPTDPVEIGYYDTSTMGGGFNGDWGVYPFRQGNVFYASDRQNGLFILEHTGGRAGWIEGVVRDAGTLAPLSGATIELVEGPFSATGAPDGTYRKGVPSGAYTVRVDRFGYATHTAPVVIPELGELTHNVNLTQLPLGSTKIEIDAEESGAPISGVLATALGTPLPPVVSDAAGEVVISGLPAGPTWTIRLGKFGRAQHEVQVVAPPNGQSVTVVELVRSFADDFETDQAWTAGAPGDNATDGIWEREIPVGSFYEGIIGPDSDASPSGEGWAYVTESHVLGAWAGTSDVDNGRTTLMTPVFDGTGLGNLTLTYQRWFSNRAPVASTDQFRADVSTNGGSTWINLETVEVSTDAWALVTLPLAPVSASMQLRFVAEDLGTDTFVEAGLDDVRILTAATAAPLVPATSATLSLGAPSPNPFRSETTIELQIPRSGPVTLDVVDVSGRRIARLLDGERIGAGTHRVQWEGRDDGGSRVAPGVYWMRLACADGEASRKVTVLR